MENNDVFTSPQYPLLNLVPFHSMSNWSVNTLLLNRLPANQEFPLVKLSELITRVKQRIIIQDSVDYQRVTVKFYGQGIVARDIECGEKIGTKSQFVISAGQFIFSQIGAQHGAFGIVPAALDNAIVTADFPTYSINSNNILPKFLVLLTTSRPFLKLCERNTKGIAQKRLANDETFLNFAIPLPSLEKQKELVANFEAKTTLADQQTQLATEKETELAAYFRKTLGIALDSDLKMVQNNFRDLTLLEFSKLNTWSLASHFKKKTFNFDNAFFEKQPIQYLIKHLESGTTPSKNNSEYWENGSIHWISPKDFEGIFINNSIDKITEKALTETPIKIHEVGSIVVVFRSSILRHSFPIALTEILTTINQDLRILKIDPSLIDPIYLANYLKIFEKDVLENSVQKGMTVESINSERFMNIKIVVPPLSVQKTMVAHANNERKTIEKLQKQAAENRIAALRDFEEALFEK